MPGVFAKLNSYPQVSIDKIKSCSILVTWAGGIGAGKVTSTNEENGDDRKSSS